MLFGKRKRVISRILIVEDEPLVAFDNEHLLGEAGYKVVGTVDSVADAEQLIDEEQIDLVLTDLTLSGDGSGADVARAARVKGVPVLFVTGHALAPDVQSLALGCLTKPFTEKGLKAALEALDGMLQGRVPKRLPAGLSLYERV
jgi:DNA-binding response OmpR family regulator